MTMDKKNAKSRIESDKSSVTLHHDVEVKQPELEKPKSAWRKVWYFIWEDNSVWSWIVNIILAFLIIKFLVYPLLGFALGTSYPIVAVVSGSMEHDGGFEDWWTDACNGKKQSDIYAQYNITKEQFKEFKFPNGFNKGDIMVLGSAENAKLGDVVVFGVQGMSDPIIHRTVRDEMTLTTKGDHNCVSASFEQEIPEEALIGKAVLRIPLLGWIKILAVETWKLVIGRA